VTTTERATHCVITARPNGGGLRCAVHDHPNPCPRNGQPAAPGPVHDDDRWGRLTAITTWIYRTARQRPLVIHEGNLDCARPSRPHDLVGDCWCRYELVPAADTP